VITPGERESRAMSMKRNEAPQVRAKKDTSPHSTGPKDSLRVPAAVEIIRFDIGGG
jgi:hypothetical protein